MSGVQPSWVGRPTGRCQRSKRTRIAGTTRFASGANPPIQRTMSTMPADSLEDTSGQPRGYQRTASRIPADNVEGASDEHPARRRTTSRMPANNVEHRGGQLRGRQRRHHGSQRCRSILLGAAFQQTTRPRSCSHRNTSTNVVMSNVDVARLKLEDRSSPLAGPSIESRARRVQVRQNALISSQLPKLGPLSLLMKGETLPVGSSWEGSPARAARASLSEVPIAAPQDANVVAVPTPATLPDTAANW
jgi:hypothetical protein